MINNQNILATLMIFLSQLKTLMKSFIQKRQTSKTAIAELFSKLSNKTKILNKQEKVTKSINFQTNMKSSGNDSLTANFINTVQINYPLTFINPGKTLVPWVLAVEQESYLPYIKKVIRKILQTTDPSH